MLKKRSKSSKKYRTKRDVLKRKSFEIFKDNDRAKTGRYYTNGSLKSISGVAISTTKSIDSSTKAKASKNSFLANYQTIYPTSPKISRNNSLLF
jgi:hypothetical protein